MAESGQKMGDYTPLAAGEKEYFLGNGEAGVVAVGKTSAGTAKTNRLVKISEIAGDKLPDGGTEGQVLTVTSADGKTGWRSALPTGGSNGYVLTKTANGPAWQEPSGGGGGGSSETIIIYDVTTDTATYNGEPLSADDARALFDADPDVKMKVYASYEGQLYSRGVAYPAVDYPDQGLWFMMKQIDSSGGDDSTIIIACDNIWSHKAIYDL